MGFKVTAPLVIIANDDGKSSDWYGYDGALVPLGLNDERCKQLAKEGMLEEVEVSQESSSDDDAKPTTIKGILAEVGDDKDKAAAALEQERAGENRSTLIEKLEAILTAGN